MSLPLPLRVSQATSDQVTSVCDLERGGESGCGGQFAMLGREVLAWADGFLGLGAGKEKALSLQAWEKGRKGPKRD